ncbi:hypothetical protein HRbin27_01811 [bacterium HR27]|nr:hypothetical protein HRbin27_01811 [bacterium HR27]
MLVSLESLRPTRSIHLHRDDFVSEETVIPSACGAALALEGVAILLFSADCVLTSDVLRGDTHMTVIEGIREPVRHHRIDERPVSQPIAEPCPCQ